MPKPFTVIKHPSHDRPAVSSSQRGVALLTILLLVVAIVIVAGSMLARQQVMVREYALLQRQSQAEQAALAGEALAIELLRKDSLANQTDSLQDVWAKPLPSSSVPGGTMRVLIKEAADRFNINNLYHAGKVDNDALAYFRALLQSQGIEPSVAQAVLDWQDPDSDTTPDGGAEADYYQSLGKPLPVAIANQPFTRIDELLVVRGMDLEKFNRLKPLITAVPYFVPMNINTVNPALLAVIPMMTDTGQQSAGQSTQPNPTPVANADTAALTSWAASRRTAMPIEAITDLWSQPAFANIGERQRKQITPLLAVYSRAFNVAVLVDIDKRQRFFVTHIAKVTPPQGSAKTAPDIVAFGRQFLTTPPQ